MKTKSLHNLLVTSPLIIALGLVTFATNVRAVDPNLTSKDKEFIKQASEAGEGEIKASEHAKKNASSEEVKTFAEEMIKDHRKAATELTRIATSKGIQPSQEPATSAKAKIKALETKKGASFDKAYSEMMVSDHKKAVELFEKASTDLDDAKLKEYATNTLPTLKHHLEMAEKLTGKPANP
jgi:putative membrane protein